MADSQNNPPGDKDAQIEREIRAERKFSLADAIGQMAGGDLMKGASPVTRQRQTEVNLELYLEKHLADAEGSLHAVLLRLLKESRTMMEGSRAQPLEVLADGCRRLLGSENLLQEFVRQVDTEWGRTYGERPYFEAPGSPPDPRDPYTLDSVRRTLTGLLEGLEKAPGGGE